MKIKIKNHANDKNWKALIAHYADGQEICNCGEAYYATDGTYWMTGSDQTFHDGRYCRSGCSGNQYRAKEYVAKKVIEDLERIEK
jgi:hypothetical protein